MWRNEGIFKETKLELNLEKKYIPENCLPYINQSYIWTVKNGDLAMYHHNFIIEHIIVAANQPRQIDQYVCKDNEVKLFTCLYDNVNLSPVDFSISFIESFSKNKKKFDPSLLNSTDQDLRKLQVAMVCGVFRQMAEYSNNNLKRNVDFLLAKLNNKADNIPWLGPSKQRFDSSLYKLTC